MPQSRSLACNDMANILVPVHAGQDAQWVNRYLLKLHQHERFRVHLLSVQPHYPGTVGLFFSQQEIWEFHREDGEKALAPMRRLLDTSGISYNAHCVVGDTVEEITKFARELHCPQIVIGRTRRNNLLDSIMGSLAQRVKALMSSTSESSCQVV